MRPDVLPATDEGDVGEEGEVQVLRQRREHARFLLLLEGGKELLGAHGTHLRHKICSSTLVD